MDGDLFEAEALLEADNVIQHRSRSTGAKVAALAAGSIAGPIEESAPTHSTPHAAIDGGGDDERQPLTGGAPASASFADRPWYRRPSVCAR